MEDLIKIASNGQWKLEKAKQNKSDAQAMIDQFLARKAAGAATPAPKPNPTAGMRPAQHATGANPMYTKEQLAAIRARIPEEARAKIPGPKPQPTPQQQHTAKVTADIDKRQAEADAQAKTTQGRKAAWEAGVAFLAQHGDRGYKALSQHMAQRKALDAAHQSGKPVTSTKPELLPPQEPFTDEKGVRGMRSRQGTFHNQGAETTGKIVNRGFKYPDKETGEDRFGSRAQQEKHHWAWDHDKKQWKHLRTTLGSPNIG